METDEKINITMSPEMLRVIRNSVDAGEYASTSALLEDAMRLWQRQRAEDAERLDSIRFWIRHSLDDPRPDLSAAQADAYLDKVLANVIGSNDDAPP